MEISRFHTTIPTMISSMALTLILSLCGHAAVAQDSKLRDASPCHISSSLQGQWPDTDFTRCTIDLSEIRSGGPPKDGIPSLDMPDFIALSEADYEPQSPLISVVFDGEARAYPLSILIWHEIVNDHIGETSFSVTYCPLCNTSVVFARDHGTYTLDFGTTGQLRHSDLVMYDRQTESWWQQYNGEAIAGALAGQSLTILPSRLESFAEFSERHPSGMILDIPSDHQRPYGITPYNGYDSARYPFLYEGSLPEGIGALERVVVVNDEAIALFHLMQSRRLERGDIRLTWSSGQASALDKAVISEGRDVGTVIAQRQEDHGKLVDVPYKVTFAFVWHAFNPESPIIGVTADEQ